MATFTNVDLYINKFKVIYQRNQPKGYLTYNYAPLRNLKINKDLYKYNKNTGFYIDINDNPIYYTKDENTIYVTKNNIDEIVNTLKAAEKSKVSTDYDSIKWAANGEEILPNHLVIEHYAGDLTEFRTDKLNLDLNHPIDIEAQESYDGSVNLILNDDLNNPRLINTRFTAKENGMYEIVDRTGNNDTNIYDEENFDSETKLYKISNNIPSKTKISVNKIPNIKDKLGIVVSDINERIKDKINVVIIICLIHFLSTFSFFIFSFLLVCTFKLFTSFNAFSCLFFLRNIWPPIKIKIGYSMVNFES